MFLTGAQERIDEQRDVLQPRSMVHERRTNREAASDPRVGWHGHTPCLELGERRLVDALESLLREPPALPQVAHESETNDVQPDRRE